MVVLTKTDYLVFQECRKNAWMKLHRPDVYFALEFSEFDKSITETGNEVEIYARRLFPRGFLIEGRDQHAQAINHRRASKISATLTSSLPAFVWAAEVV